MKVLALTIFVGLILVGFFVFLWIAAACDPRQFSERDALLPLEDDDAPSPFRPFGPLRPSKGPKGQQGPQTTNP